MNRYFSSEDIQIASKYMKRCSTSLAIQFSSVQFSCSVMSDSLRPHDCSTPGLGVHHQLPEFTQTHVHRVSDAIQPSHPQSSGILAMAGYCSDMRNVTGATEGSASSSHRKRKSSSFYPLSVLFLATAACL